MSTDTSEKGLESLIVRAMVGTPADEPGPGGAVGEDSALFGGTGWLPGKSGDYNRDYAVDIAHLKAFLEKTQPVVAAALDLENDGHTRQKFLARLQGEIAKRGVMDVLLKGLNHGPHHVVLYYVLPSEGNVQATERYRDNRFSVTRQLRYSADETQLALDLCLFINGLPIATFELKNSLTKQTVSDAIEQYKRDRNSRELLFRFGRCLVHFAVDDQQVYFCTHLKDKASWFLPFNQGWNNGAGNPPNPDGLMTDYLWKRILTPEGISDIIENYALFTVRTDIRTNRKIREQIFPRYHQLDVVRKLLADAKAKGAGRRYLIQHSTGSGKSNSIAWLAHQLVGLRVGGTPVFDSIIVVTDRRILDQQLKDTIRKFAQVGATVGHADSSAELRQMIESGKKIIISTVQKFPHIMDAIGDEHRGRKFAIIIDEAHSSQGGRTSNAMAGALGQVVTDADDDDETIEDKINEEMEKRKMLTNASYFAFTATPKNKTLEIFGDPVPIDGEVRHRPFHTYTMKQAIEEGFILDVLKHYTPIESYYRLVKTVEADPEFDTRRAQKKLRHYVESHRYAIRTKAEIMVDHFTENVAGLYKIGGKARAMVVTTGVRRAIEYYAAISAYLTETKSPFKAIVAFSGEHEFNGVNVTEASLNGFPGHQIPEVFREDPYRFLICADKFQTGYDEPLLHTMYVDKILSGIKAVQTLSRLNRSHPGKYDVFVLDFANDQDTIESAFSDYYTTTVLSRETDPNRLHDLKADLDAGEVYTPDDIQHIVEQYLGGADRERLDPILDECVASYLVRNEDEQVDFKGKAKAFLRAYDFLASILPFKNAEWEKLSIFLNLLVPKLPAPKEEDLARGILETVDMDSYRVEKRGTRSLMPDVDGGEVDPASLGGGGHQPEPEIDRLSAIIAAFNELFGNIQWQDGDRVQRLITEDIPARVNADEAYQNAKLNNDRQNARVEHDSALDRVMTGIMSDDTELFKLFADNPSFRQWLQEHVFSLTYGSGPVTSVLPGMQDIAPSAGA